VVVCLLLSAHHAVIFAIAQLSCYYLCVCVNRAFAMQSTVNWMDEMSTKLHTESNSSEDVVTPVMRLSSGIRIRFRVTVLALKILGLLANLLVLFGFWLAGRSKMNISSAYIANHTTLEQHSFTSTFKPSILTDTLVCC